MLLDEARAVLATGPICDACLGRAFAERSHGLSNGERGRALRVAVAMADDADFAPPDPAACWVCEGVCDRYDEWAERVVEALGDVEFETYQVGTRVPPLLEENDRLLREEADLDPETGEPFKSAFNREVGKRVGRRTGTEVDLSRPDVLAICHLERETVEVQVNPAFVYGRYRKLEREVPQTEWPCRECGGSGKQLGPDGEEPCEHCGGSGYLYETSVEQEIAPRVREAMEGEAALFHGAGREDVDALMLGTGRPFVVEVKKPRRRTPDADALQAAINDASDVVEVEGLRPATYEMVERVKELPASKTYRARVTFDADVSGADLRDALAALAGATVEQRTPERVDHRRADRVRERTVYAAEGDLTGDRRATLEIHGEGGLYVKELISGDGGRTDPSLAGLLGVGAEVTELDVLAVEGEDEPFEDETYFQ
jgi:tRNA pseudouridine synthase 10